MTKKEAIEILKNYHNGYFGYKIDDVHEAHNLAIKALMAYRDCKHCTHNIKVGNMRGCAIWDCDFEDIRGAE